MGTAGALAKWLSRAAGGRHHYLGGQVLHSPAMLVQSLGESRDLVAQFGPASREVAEALAAQTRRQFDADYALVVGPFPEKIDGNHEHDVPFHFALAGPDKVTVKASNMYGHSSIWVPRAGKAALNLLRLTLLGEM